jgi:hypothetical protein
VWQGGISQAAKVVFERFVEIYNESEKVGPDWQMNLRTTEQEAAEA